MVVSQVLYLQHDHNLYRAFRIVACFLILVVHAYKLYHMPGNKMQNLKSFSSLSLSVSVYVSVCLSVCLSLLHVEGFASKCTVTQCNCCTYTVCKKVGKLKLMSSFAKRYQQNYVLQNIKWKTQNVGENSCQ